MLPGKEKAMAGKLLSTWKEEYPDLNSEEMLRSLHDYFEKCKNVPGTWLRNNMSLGLMVSKHNEIEASFKNPKNARVLLPQDLSNMNYEGGLR